MSLWNFGISITIVSTLLIVFVYGIDINDTIIENLAVEAIKYDEHTLQLNVSWSLNNNNGTQFDIIIKPHEQDDCSTYPCAEFGYTTTEIILPKDPMSMHEHKDVCSIQPGCTYDILVETNNRKFYTNQTYHVPDCIHGICSCLHSTQLPIVRIEKLIIRDSNLYIEWLLFATPEQLKTIDNVQYIFLQVGEQNYTLIPGGGPYELVGSYKITDFRSKFHGEINVAVPKPRYNRINYSIKGYVVDKKGCAGLENKRTYDWTEPSASEFWKGFKHFLWIFLALVGIFLTIIILIFLVHRAIKNAKKKEQLHNYRGVFHNDSSSGIPHVTMLENLLYVDKDILEARTRGDADMLEVPHTCLTFGREIGKGAFGRVFIARAENICGKPGSQVVAVKQLKKRSSPEELEEFLSEISMMKTVSYHPNIVSLLACCTIKQPLLMIMEYVGCGDLLQYLRQVRGRHEARSTVVSGFRMGNSMSDVFDSNTTAQKPVNNVITQSPSEVQGPFGKYLDLLHSSTTSTISDSTYATEADILQSNLRPSVTETLYTMLSRNPADVWSNSSLLEYVLDHRELHNFATQIARGMKHLHEREITHRDLAARNILIDETKTLKISDFGLSRSGIYVNTRSKKVPLRWLSIEAMRDNLYSSKSDIWAFGVLLWEIGTLGGFPYPTVSNHELLQFLMSGQRLQRPENCSEHLYELMLQCWAENSDDRPEFINIVRILEPQHQKVYVDFNDLSSEYVFPPTLEQLKMNKDLKFQGENHHK